MLIDPRAEGGREPTDLDASAEGLGLSLNATQRGLRRGDPALKRGCLGRVSLTIISGCAARHAGSSLPGQGLNLGRRSESAESLLLDRQGSPSRRILDSD